EGNPSIGASNDSHTLASDSAQIIVFLTDGEQGQLHNFHHRSNAANDDVDVSLPSDQSEEERVTEQKIRTSEPKESRRWRSRKYHSSLSLSSESSTTSDKVKTKTNSYFKKTSGGATSSSSTSSSSTETDSTLIGPRLPKNSSLPQGHLSGEEDNESNFERGQLYPSQRLLPFNLIDLQLFFELIYVAT
ncbi:unnamed protein product, partial [Protopolystoma xenopodis]